MATAGNRTRSPADGRRSDPSDGPPPAAERLALAAIGATPVSLIGLSTFGIFSLKQLAIAALVPGMCVLVVLIAARATTRKLLVAAIPAGLVATLLYDLFRWWFLAAGWMDRDPIPHIGTGLGLEPGWLFGYLWRFLGNGGGLAIVFFAAGARGVVAGTAHGLLVCSGLLGVLLFSPNGQAILFPLEPATLVVAVVGHIIYGATLGFLSRLLPPSAR